MKPLLLHFLLFAALIGLPTVVSANPEDNYLERLDELVESYGFDVGERPEFDEKRFNQILKRARQAVGHAVWFAERGDLRASASWLARSVDLDDQATVLGDSRGMSGTGFSDDLASFATFILGELHADLTEMLAFDPTVPDALVDYLDELGDFAYSFSRNDDFTRAAYIYSWGVTLAEWWTR